ncbi:choline transporter-like 2 [Drosophila takahashii]|uniref:choline transporter-like 2 n=1 Tax=Drosophila takahashii TaxID=29030 RepID=UPI001CF8B06C|nr:choline transporter-like 2 [Drosophila takahashii]
MKEKSEDKETEYGKPLTYDKNFSGPRQRNRSCTDVPCLLLFVLFLGGWGFIAEFAVRKGDLQRLVAPMDSSNKVCGVDPGVENKTNVFYFDMTKCLNPLLDCKTPKVCLESCPTQVFHFDLMRRTKTFKELHSRLICRTEEDKSKIRTVAEMEHAIDQNLCARWYINSSPFLNRCLFDLSFNACDLISSSAPQDQKSLSTEKGVDSITAKILEMVLKSTGQTAENCKLGFNSDIVKEKMAQTKSQMGKMGCNMLPIFFNGTEKVQKVCEEVIEDLEKTPMFLLKAGCCALIASLIYIALMRWFSGQILWFSIFGVLIGLLLPLIYCITQYIHWRNATEEPKTDLSVENIVQKVLHDQHFWLGLSIFLGLCFVVILLIVIVLLKRIRIAIALVKEGSKAVSSVISTMFFPIFSWILFIVAIAFAIFVGLHLFSIKEASFKMVRQSAESKEICKCEGPASGYTVGESCSPEEFEQHCFIQQTGDHEKSPVPCSSTTCSLDDFVLSPLIKAALFYNVFGFFWLSFFISAFSYMVLAFTFARWYWTLKKRDVPFFTLTGAFFQTAFYHLGTVAFGSFILALVRVGCLVLEYLNTKVKAHDNWVTRAIRWLLRCLFWLLDAFLKFATHNAYIMCAIHGKNFCSSAKESFKLVLRNSLRVVTLGFATEFLFFLSKVLLSSGAGVSTYFFLSNYPDVIKLHYNLVPAILVAISTYLITYVFFGVYSTAVDTLFLCFLEDCERNDGSQEKPYFMSKRLKRILGKRNQ